MSEESLKVNPKIIDAVIQTNSAVLGQAGAFGAAAAYEQVSHSMALAVQDSVDHLRNVAVLSTTAVGIALAFTAASAAKQEPPPTAVKDLLNDAKDVLDQAAAHMMTVGTDASDILSKFAP